MAGLKKIERRKKTRKKKVAELENLTAIRKKKGRKCSICGVVGEHNARTCPEKNKPIEEIVTPASTLSAAKKKEKELGHSLLAAQNKKVEREEIDGLVPQKGLWIVHHKKQKVAGKIVKVKRNGDVTWKSALGATINTPQGIFKDEGYSYLQDLEPEMLRWTIV